MNDVLVDPRLLRLESIKQAVATGAKRYEVVELASEIAQFIEGPIREPVILAKEVLWLVKRHSATNWMTVAVDVDPVTRNGEVISVGSGDTEDASKINCVKMMVELGRTETPGEIVWREQPASP